MGIRSGLLMPVLLLAICAVPVSCPARDAEEVRALLDEGRYAAAETAARALVAEAETSGGPSSSAAADALDLLVEALRKGGKASEPDTRRLAERVVAIRQGKAAADPAALGHSLNSLGLVFFRSGEYAEARRVLERALEVREDALGADSPAVADTLNNLAGVFWETGERGEARRYVERALRIREESLGPSHPKTAQTQGNLAILLKAEGDLAAARALYERALETRERELGPDHPDTAASLNNLAAFFEETGRYEDARPLYERALAILESALGSDHPDVGMTLQNLGLLMGRLGDYTASKALYVQALAVWEKSLGPDHPDVALVLTNLGAQLRNLGEYSPALSAYERALLIREKVYGPGDPRVAVVLHNQAILLSSSGEWERARDLALRALRIMEAAWGPEDPRLAPSRNLLARILRDLGDREESRRLCASSLRQLEKRFGRDHPRTASTLNSMAGLLHESGDLEGARRNWQRVLDIREKELGAEHPLVAAALTNLALGSRLVGDNETARLLAERALAIRVKVLGPDNPALAWTLTTLARVKEEEGDLEGALALNRRALAIRRRAYGPVHPMTAWNLDHRARLLAGLDLRRKAFAAARETEEAGREHLRIVLRGLAEREALRFAEIRTSGLDTMLSLCVETLCLGEDPAGRETIRTSWDTVIRSRALVMDEMAARARTAMLSEDPEIRDRAEDLAAARRRIANLTVRGQGAETEERYRSLLEEARREREEAERELARCSASFRAGSTARDAGFADVRRALPEGWALVAWVRYWHRSPGWGRAAEGRPPHTGPPPEMTSAWLAFVLPAGGGEPAMVNLGGAEEIDRLVEAWRREAGPARVLRARDPREAEALYRLAGETLRRAVWDPVAAHLGEAEGIFLVPDGILHLVSFGSLPTGDDRYLFEGEALLHYLSTERDLVEAPRPDDGGEGLLAMGGADFDERSLFSSLAPGLPGNSAEAPLQVASRHLFRGERSSCRGFGGLRFEPLPGTHREAEDVSALWRKGGRPGSVSLLQGNTATESAFKQQATGRAVVHLATHGFFLGGSCPVSGLRTRGFSLPAELSPDTAPPPPHGESPLLLSGLALAGANHRESAREGEEDGVVTAEEIAALDLSDTDWVVLSGCGTGLGRIHAGEGVLGLRRAFSVAGARTMIMSLWEVDDDATLEWMRALYQARTQKGFTTAGSMRDASLTVLQSRRGKGLSTHPYFWSGFVAAGDWR